MAQTAIPDTDRVPFLVEIVLYFDKIQPVTLHSSTRLMAAGVFGIEMIETQNNTALQVRVMKFNQSNTTNTGQMPNNSTEPSKQYLHVPHGASTLLMIVLLSIASISAICAYCCIYHHLWVWEYAQEPQTQENLLQRYHQNTVNQTNPPYHKYTQVVPQQQQ
jgi:hypothetical protein